MSGTDFGGRRNGDINTKRLKIEFAPSANPTWFCHQLTFMNKTKHKNTKQKPPQHTVGKPKPTKGLHTQVKAEMKSAKSKKANPKLHVSHHGGVWWVGVEPDLAAKNNLLKRSVMKLCRRLLHIGGKRVCVPLQEPPIMWDEMAKSGVTFQSSGLKLKRGWPCHCHANCVRLWQRNKNKYHIVTGYGMMADQEWRRHSWLVDKSGKVIETTVPRQIYFGIVFKDESAEEFCKIYGE